MQIVSRGDVLENASWRDKHSFVCLNWSGKDEQPGRNLWSHEKRVLEPDRGSNFITTVGLSKVIQLDT